MKNETMRQQTRQKLILPNLRILYLIQQFSLQIYIELQIFFTQMFLKDKQKEIGCLKSNGFCRTHLFQLKNLNRLSQTLDTAQLQYCPIFSQQTQQFENIFPSFNFDEKYYTPAFVLPLDKHFILQNQFLEKDRFDRAVEQKLNKSENFNFNRPYKNNQYCHVCKNKYDDYLEHIGQIQHKTNIKKSKGDTYIRELCVIYKQEEKLKRTKIQKETVCSKINRTSARLRQAEEKKKQKEQIICEVSTMTSQKQLKSQEQELKIKFKRNKIIQKIDFKPKNQRRNRRLLPLSQ